MDVAQNRMCKILICKSSTIHIDLIRSYNLEVYSMNNTTYHIISYVCLFLYCIYAQTFSTCLQHTVDHVGSLVVAIAPFTANIWHTILISDFLQLHKTMPWPKRHTRGATRGAHRSSSHHHRLVHVERNFQSQPLTERPSKKFKKILWCFGSFDFYCRKKHRRMPKKTTDMLHPYKSIAKPGAPIFQPN